jgi:hypothetical protein
VLVFGKGKSNDSIVTSYKHLRALILRTSYRQAEAGKQKVENLGLRGQIKDLVI